MQVFLPLQADLEQAFVDLAHSIAKPAKQIQSTLFQLLHRGWGSIKVYPFRLCFRRHLGDGHLQLAVHLGNRAKVPVTYTTTVDQLLCLRIFCHAQLQRR